MKSQPQHATFVFSVSGILIISILWDDVPIMKNETLAFPTNKPLRRKLNCRMNKTSWWKLFWEIYYRDS